MRTRIACGLDSRSWAGFWKNDRAAVRAVRTIQYNNLLFIILYNIYNLLFIRPAAITHNPIAIRHPVTIIFIFTIVLPQNVIFWSVQSIAYATLLERSDDNALRMAFHAADTHRSTSEGGWRKGADWNRELAFFFRLRNRQKLVRIRFGCGLDSRIYGIWHILCWTMLCVLCNAFNISVVTLLLHICDITSH